jgi:FkbM family methyltransferase
MNAKELTRLLFQKLGYEIRKIRRPAAASAERPVGDMRALLEDLRMRGLQCSMILDVGAHKSDWSRLAKSVFPDAKMLLIEPQVEMQTFLDGFCAQFSGASYFQGGAGATPEKRVFTVWPDLAGSSFLPPADAAQQARGTQRIVEIETIDNLLLKNALPVPQLMKLDIQGFELEALKGAGSTFGTTEAYILEASLIAFSDVPGIPLFAEVIEFMRERKYVVYDFAGFLRRPFDGALGQCDLCFVKENSFLRKSSAWS